jgi:uncharacterized protein (DUF736 family)
MKIGYLGDDLAGEIRLVSPPLVSKIWLEEIEPNVRDTEDSPHYRVVVPISGNSVEIGAAWRKTKNGRAYLSATIDQPGWPDAVSFGVFPAKGGGHDLSYNRRKSA